MRLAVGQREEGLARARRQEPQHRLRRRGPREVRPGVAVLGLRQRGPGLLRAEPDPGRAVGPRPGRRGVRGGDPERSASATRRTTRPRSGRSSASSSATASGTTSRSAWPRAPRSSSAASAPSDPALAEGAYLMPTVFDGVTNDMRIAREEIFGPVVSIIPFDTEEEALRLANATPYGLSRLDLEPRHRQGAARRQGAPGRGHQRQLELVGPHRGAVRRLQDVGHRARARDVCAGPLHRDQERLHRPELTRIRMVDDGPDLETGRAARAAGRVARRVGRRPRGSRGDAPSAGAPDSSHQCREQVAVASAPAAANSLPTIAPAASGRSSPAPISVAGPSPWPMGRGRPRSAEPSFRHARPSADPGDFDPLR